jgi:hypothetical protein
MASDISAPTPTEKGEARRLLMWLRSLEFSGQLGKNIRLLWTFIACPDDQLVSEKR